MTDHTIAGSLIAEPPLMFPSSVTVGDATITIKADGTWEGDRDAFLKALSEAKSDHTPLAMVIVWLVANAMLRG